VVVDSIENIKRRWVRLLLLLVSRALLSGKLQNENKNKNLFWGISRALLS
jgi:hypothetical protein